MRRSDPTRQGAETGEQLLWHQRRRAGEVREGFVGMGALRVDRSSVSTQGCLRRDKNVKVIE